jgi:hypothetical protein
MDAEPAPLAEIIAERGRLGQESATATAAERPANRRLCRTLSSFVSSCHSDSPLPMIEGWLVP